MSWDALGAIGEIVSAFAVLITLLYLATQIRNQNKIATAEIHQQRAASMPVLVAPILASDENVELMGRVIRAEVEPDELSADDLYRIQLLLGPIRANLENTFLQHENGFLEEDVYLGGFIANCATYGPAFLKFGMPLSDRLREEILRVIAEKKPGLGEYRY